DSCVTDAGSPEPILRGIDRLVLRVPNLPAAVKYYRDVLGLRVVRDGTSFATLALGDGREVLLHNDPDLPEEAVFLLVEDVRQMHADRATLRLNFVAPPSRVSKGYKATVKDPFGTVLLLIDRSLDDTSGDAAEDVKTPHALFPGVAPTYQAKPELLATLYEKAGRTADDLPYTPQFEQLYAGYATQWPEPQPSRAEVWRHLLGQRKKGNLPKLGPARSKPPVVDEPTQLLIRKLVAETIGESIGRRDRLPYSPEFDRFTEQFNRARSRSEQPPMTPHQLWRVVASMAK
ncbi:MAG: VOC family protein, partial [Planctomycetota bacterium]